MLSFFAIFPKFAIQQYLNDEVALNPISLIRIILVPRENVWGHFWFLPMIFLLGIFGFLLNRIFKKYQVTSSGWFLTTLISFGIYAGLYRQDISGWFALNDIISFGWIFSLGALCAYFNLLERMHANAFKAIIFFILALFIFLFKFPIALTPYKDAAIAVLMISSLLMFSQLASKYIRVNRMALYSQTFTIFILSWPIQAVCNVLIERLLHMPFYIIMPLQFSSGVIGPMIIIILLEKFEKKFRMRWFNLAIGK